LDKVGKYLILGKLGQGGMGVVYRALDPLLERVVALKTISAHLDSQPELRARFFREGRSAAHLSHRNIITVYDIGEDNGVAYLAMECLEGQDLKATIAKRSHFSLQKKLAIVMDVCQGLAHAHSRQVIHRDIKPANIFLTNSGEVKILDFGLARMVAADITHTGAPLGTPNYMSPEQVRGERADHRSDIFSVGAVLYELLALRRAFDEDSVPATIMKILLTDPESVAKFDPSIDPALSAAVMRALAKDPDARYQSVDDLLNDLRQSASSLPLSVEESNPEILFDATRPRSDAVPELPTIETPAGKSSLPVGEERRRQSVVTVISTAPSVEPPPQKPQVAAVPPAEAVPGASRGLLWGGIAVFLVLLLSLSIWWVRRKPDDAPRSESLTPQSRSPATSDTDSNRADRAQAREVVPPVPIAPPPPVRSQVAEENRKAELEAASPRARQVKDAPADHPDSRAVQARLDEAAKTSAGDALRQMIESRTKAENAGAPQLAANSYEAARKIETEARALYDGGQYQRAGARFYETSGLYTSAALEAASQKEMRARLSEQEHRTAVLRSEAELSRRSYEQVLHGAQTAGAQERASSKYQEASGLAVEAQSSFSQQDYAGARSHWDAAGAAMEQARAAAVELARTPVAPADDGPPKPVPPPSAESERQLVASSLQRYAAALQARDIAALKVVWPGLSGKQEEAIRHEFSNSRDIHVQLVDIEIRVTGDTATAAARRIYQLQTLDGQRLETANRAFLSLHRSGGTWLIDRIRFEPLR
jgi:serine/threonine protein kinase